MVERKSNKNNYYHLSGLTVFLTILTEVAARHQCPFSHSFRCPKVLIKSRKKILIGDNRVLEVNYKFLKDRIFSEKLFHFNKKKLPKFVTINCLYELRMRCDG